MRERVDQLIDRTRTGRHTDVAYYNAINAAIDTILKDRIEPIRLPRKYSIQSSQRIRDELYTLVPAPVIGNITLATVTFPADYLYYLLLYVTADASFPATACTPTSYNEISETKINPFLKPSSTKLYFNENVGGLLVHTDTLTTLVNAPYELWYVKNPAVVSIGYQRDKILAGGSVNNGTTYYVYEQTVYNGVTYEEGETFVAGATATITSGIVIVASVVVNCDLPVNMHEEVNKLAAAFLSGNVEDYQKKQTFDIDVEKS